MLDVAILGGGPVGNALALTLAQASRACAIFERRGIDDPVAASLAARPLALSYATRLILERIGAWPAEAVTAIDAIHVSQSGMPGRVWLSAADAGVPALGYVLEYGRLMARLRERIGAAGIQTHYGAPAQAGYASRDAIAISLEGRRSVSARCAVHAEGAGDDMAQRHYQQEAIAAVLEVESGAGHTAYERFTPEGPLALLPMAGTYALVWSARPERARALLAAPEASFLAELQGRLSARVGTLRAVRGRQHVPVIQRLRATRIAERAVFIGNAAQTLHPVAGQGLNLGFRDAWELASLFADAPDPGAATLLRRYAAKRRADAGATVLVTDLLASRFATGNPLARTLGGVALTALDLLPAPRRFFTRRMIYGLRALP